MEGKKSFILYVDLISVVEKLSNEQAGILFKIIMDYVNDKNPVIHDLLMEVAFLPIKNQLKRDLKIWQEQRKQRSSAGKKGMEKRWGTDNTVKKNITDDNTVIKSITNITVNDNVNANVIDIVTYLNDKVNSKFSHHARNIQQLVMDRMDEKFTVKDFKKVIDNKCSEWLNTKYAKYLRPETLFSVEHFDSYLNEKQQPKYSPIV